MKSKFNIKILFFMLAFIFLILTILTIRSTYARYVTSLTAGGSVELGRWLIKVNDQNIMENSDLSKKIIPKFSGSTYIAEDKIVPTSTGSVQIKLDYQDVTVPFQYDISFATSEDTFLEDFKITSYSVDDGELINTTETFTSITDSIYPNNATRTRVIKLNFTWLDGDGEQLDDVEDTTFSYITDELGLRFNLTFTQLQPII